MKENVKKFEKDLRESEDLRKKLTEELKRIVTEKEAQSDAEAISLAAKALGYDFTVADMEKANAETQELDPEEMNQAAGSNDCIVNYDCYAAFKHDSPDKKGTKCLKDYDCYSVYHNSELGGVVQWHIDIFRCIAGPNWVKK